MTGRGTFIAFEGVEGSGKSTQSARLAETIREKGMEVVETREPGGTERGAAIRAILLDPALGRLDPIAEALLYAADRAIHVSEVIEPALERGALVISDRFSDSYRAYQGGGRGLDELEIDKISKLASRGLEPDLVVLLDIPVEAGIARIGGEPDRMELEGGEFHRAVRQRFLDLASASDGRFAVVDASLPADDVADLVSGIVAERLAPPS